MYVISTHFFIGCLKYRSTNASSLVQPHTLDDDRRFAKMYKLSSVVCKTSVIFSSMREFSSESSFLARFVISCFGGD